jgi:hypothetical protein
MPAVSINENPTPVPKRDKATSLFREAVGGDKRAAVRRIILWVLAFALLVGDAPAWLTLMPLALLCTTDGLV